jgi:hypothetical protein
MFENLRRQKEMIILPYKEKFIQENFIAFSFNSENGECLPEFKLFQKLNSTDQYYLAENYNWDDGVEILKWIIESKKCDKGTASLIFWTSEPNYFFEKSESEISDYEKDTFLLLKRIVEKFNNNEFKKSNLKYNPSERVKGVDWSKLNDEWIIPKELIETTKGFSVISLRLIQKKIGLWQRQRKEAKRAKKRLNRKK